MRSLKLVFLNDTKRLLDSAYIWHIKYSALRDFIYNTGHGVNNTGTCAYSPVMILYIDIYNWQFANHDR